MGLVADMLRHTPAEPGVDDQALVACIEACFECAPACIACAEACRRCEEGCDTLRAAEPVS